jgi:hypothetical protein
LLRGLTFLIFVCLDHVSEVFKPVAVSIDVEDMGFIELTVQDDGGFHLKNIHGLAK